MFVPESDLDLLAFNARVRNLTDQELTQCVRCRHVIMDRCHTIFIECILIYSGSSA
jgi:hypothetical protein